MLYRTIGKPPIYPKLSLGTFVGNVKYTFHMRSTPKRNSETTPIRNVHEPQAPGPRHEKSARSPRLRVVKCIKGGRAIRSYLISIATSNSPCKRIGCNRFGYK